jgi:hypothetical protein
MHRLFVLTLPALALACNELDPSVPDEPEENLKADPDCESFTDSEGEVFYIEGATRYLVVDFNISGDDISGTLQYMLFANQEWKDYGQDDCQVQWTAAGKISEDTDACGACDQHLDVDYALDMSNTDCPADFYEGLEQASESYDVLLRDDDNGASIYWSGSGNLFTDNAWATKKRIWGHSDPACSWFGSSE